MIPTVSDNVLRDAVVNELGNDPKASDSVTSTEDNGAESATADLAMQGSSKD